MNQQQPKRRLGRGLAALIGDDAHELAAQEEVRSAGGVRHVPIDLLAPNPNNPRRHFDEDEIADLARSIEHKGLIQPLVVRRRGDGKSFEIVAGERRWRAAQKAGRHELPVLVQNFTDGEALEIALIENIQRSDLNPIEEARGYAQLMQEFQYTQQQLAHSVGKSRSHIANTLRLMNLPETVRLRIETGELTAGHARALIATDAAEELADRIVAQGLSVRQAEELARRGHPPSGRAAKGQGATKSADVAALEKVLSERLGLHVEIADKGDTGGQIVIRYKTLEQLDDVCQRLTA